MGHPKHSQFSVAEVLEHERPHLMPMSEPFDGYVEDRRECRAPAWSRWRATVTRCRASWPDRWLARGRIQAASCSSAMTQESIDTIAQDLGPSLLGLAQAVRHELPLQKPRSG